MNLIDAFDIFLDRIELGQKQIDRIESAISGLRSTLGNAFDVEDGKRESWLFAQGSYANETAIMPAKDDGEYDIDLVAMSAEGSDSPNDALDAISDILEANGTYTDKVEKRDPCVRLQYADEDGVGGFHVDIVPARESSGDAPIEVPRRNEDWHGSDPKRFTDWAGGQGDEFKRAVKMLKRWRDHNGDARTNIKSIILQVLIADHLTDFSADAPRIEGTLKNIKEFLDEHTTVPGIKNPVLDSENLAARWTHAEYYEFKSVLADAVAKATEALLTDDVARAHALWQELFGDDFPDSKSDDEVKGTIPPSPAREPGRVAYG